MKLPNKRSIWRSIFMLQLGRTEEKNLYLKICHAKRTSVHDHYIKTSHSSSLLYSVTLSYYATWVSYAKYDGATGADTRGLKYHREFSRTHQLPH